MHPIRTPNSDSHLFRLIDGSRIQSLTRDRVGTLVQGTCYQDLLVGETGIIEGPESSWGRLDPSAVVEIQYPSLDKKPSRHPLPTLTLLNLHCPSRTPI